jgi:hypothetical protein
MSVHDAVVKQSMHAWVETESSPLVTAKLLEKLLLLVLVPPVPLVQSVWHVGSGPPASH